MAAGDDMNLLYNVYLDFGKTHPKDRDEFLSNYQLLQFTYMTNGWGSMTTFKQDVLQFCIHLYDSKFGIQRLFDKEGRLIKIVWVG